MKLGNQFKQDLEDRPQRLTTYQRSGNMLDESNPEINVVPALKLVNDQLAIALAVDGYEVFESDDLAAIIEKMNELGQMNRSQLDTLLQPFREAKTKGPISLSSLKNETGK